MAEAGFSPTGPRGARGLCGLPEVLIDVRMEQAVRLWRIAMAQMAALNALAADRRKWAMLPDWRRLERRALAEAQLNNYFNEIDRIIAQRSTPDTQRPTAS